MASNYQHAVIVKPGQPGKSEPYAKLEDGRIEPMGLNIGETFNVGDQGMAEWGQLGDLSSWYFIYFEPADEQATAEQDKTLVNNVIGAMTNTGWHEASYETLTCKHGHTWTRPKGGRGRKPPYCPEHKPLPPKNVEPQVLRCKHGAGHEWTREPQRGAKPEYCPAHKPAPAKPANALPEAHSTPVEVSTQTPSDDRPKSKSSNVVSRVKPEALQILQGHKDELQLKLGYVVAALSDPAWLARRDPEDVNLMIKRQKELIREHNRRGLRTR